MGACQPNNLNSGSSIPNMQVMYSDARLPLAEMNNYRTAFEKEFFQIVNLLRVNPESFVKFVK
jgi:hypothetical protein